MEIKKVMIEKEVYVASDGKEFDDEWQCEDYESGLESDKLEKETDDKLRIYTHADFPSMIDTAKEHECRLFLIKNEEDLKLFVRGYSYWFRNLYRYCEVDKDTFTYPDVLCILDFPRGGEECRLYRMSQLREQFNAFTKEIDKHMGIKQEWCHNQVIFNQYGKNSTQITNVGTLIIE